jgi:hypothetical protein
LEDSRLEDPKFRFLVRYAQVISLLFALMGLYWALAGTADPFGIYERLMATNFWGEESLPEDARLTFQFLLVPLGATCAGYFTMQFFIATYAFANREKWGYAAIVVPFFVWFVIDTSLCLLHGAYFNIYFANITSLAAMLPVIFSYRYFW